MPGWAEVRPTRRADPDSLPSRRFHPGRNDRRPGVGRGRQGHHEPRALARLGLHERAPTVRLRDRGHDREAQPGASAVARARRVGPVEPLERPRRLVRRQARALSATSSSARAPERAAGSRSPARRGGVCARTLPSRLSSTWRRRVGSPTTDERLGVAARAAREGSTARAASTASRSRARPGRPGRARAAGPGRAARAAAARRPARPSGATRARCRPSPARGPPGARARRARTARRRPGPRSAACAARARRRRRSAAAAARTRCARRTPPRAGRASR